MYTFDKYIGQKVRRIVYMLKTGNKYYHLMSVFEHLELDMADICEYPIGKDGRPFMKCVKNADANKKVYLLIDEITLTKELYEEPWNNLSEDGDSILPTSSEFAFKCLSYEGAEVISLSDNSKHPITHILPHRSCASYVSCFVPKLPSEGLLSEWKEDEKIRKQLSHLSKEYLGYDMCEWDKYLGQYIFVSYNPIYRAIHWRENEKGLGIYCRINFRDGKRQLLKICVEGYNNSNVPVFEDYIETDNFEKFISFQSHQDKTYKYLKIYVRDQDGILIDYFPHLNFIHQISMDFMVHERTLRIFDKTRNVVREVEKYSSENVNVGTAIEESLLDDNDYAYQKLEEALDFVYLDGDKDGTHIHREKGIELVQRIINSAKERCYICDVYFNTSDFEEFIWGASSLSVDMRILTSKLGLPTDSAKEEMSMRVNEYKEKVGGKVTCRLLFGEPILHDRLIIADEQVWMLGSSLNHFGAKATTLIRVPKAYRKRLIEKVEYWWSNDTESKELAI